MKKILLPEAGENLRYYRANLHCHSTISDGRKSPEELKASYKARGYSVIAYTDHDVFLRHNDLTDKDFLALNGYEMEVGEAAAPGATYTRTCHMCFVALEPDTEKAACYHRSSYIWGNAVKYRDQIVFDETLPDYVRTYDPACISDMMKKGREGGFFVTYNHPTWSLESYREYMGYENMNAMEMVNFGCVQVGYNEDNGHCYDDMLRGGKHIFCIAADDNHNCAADDSPYCDSFGAYTMIAADKLEYRTVTKALEDGMFYCSTGSGTHDGPQILGLTCEDGVVTIKTSPAKRICLYNNARSNQIRIAPDGEFLTEASFRISEQEVWFRLCAIDAEGWKAYTNAYFPAEF